MKYLTNSVILDTDVDGSGSTCSAMGDFSFIKSVISPYLPFSWKSFKTSLYGATSWSSHWRRKLWGDI
jgi:hypothetical protein